MKNLFKIHIIKNFIIAFTLTFTLAFTLILTLTIISTSNANANMFNKFKKGFYFEKYSEADMARKEYYKIINYDKRLLDARNEISKKYGYDHYQYDLKNKEMIKELDDISILTKQDDENIIKLRNEKNYKNDAMTALLKIHPIGSDPRELVKTLEEAGANNQTPKSKQQNGGWDSIKINDKEVFVGNFLSFFYKMESISLFYLHTIKHWKVFIEHDKNKILNVSVYNYRGL